MTTPTTGFPCGRCYGTGRNKHGGPCKTCRGTGRTGAVAAGVDTIATLIKLGLAVAIIVIIAIALITGGK